MNYGRDYGNRNFLERAAHTVRGWMGRGGGEDRFYDDEFRGGMANRGWNEDRGYREMGDVSGYRGGYDRGYGATNWRGRNPDWDRGTGGGGWGGGGYRTGGYQADHGSWDVDWDENRSGGYGMDRGMNRGGMDRGYTGGGFAGGGGYSGGSGGGYGGDERDHYMGRDFMTNEPHFGHGYRGDRGESTVDTNRGGGDWNRTGGGMMGRGMQGGSNRGMYRDLDETDRGDWNRGGGMDRGYGGGAGAGMLGGDADMGDASGGTIGNYGPYGNYGMERFRSASGGGVAPGQYYRGYGIGSGYR